MTVVVENIHQTLAYLQTLESLRGLEKILDRKIANAKKGTNYYKYLPKPVQLLSNLYATSQQLPATERQPIIDMITYIDEIYDKFEIHIKKRKSTHKNPKILS